MNAASTLSHQLATHPVRPASEVVFLSSDHLVFERDDDATTRMPPHWAETLQWEYDADEFTEEHPGPGPWTLMVHSLEAVWPTAPPSQEEVRPPRLSSSSITVIGAPRPAMRPPPQGAALPVYSPPSWVQPPIALAPVSVQPRSSTLMWVTAFAAMGILCGLFLASVLRSKVHRPHAVATSITAPAQRPEAQARPLPSIGVVMPDGVTPTPAGRTVEKAEKPAAAPRPRKGERAP